MGELQAKSLGLRYCELPEYVREEILARLPVESLCRFRIVCQEWNALLSSAKFITSKWAEAPHNKNPWLLVQNVYSKMPNCWVYCFYTRTWEKPSRISLSFLKEIQNYIHCLGSAAGLFLVTDFLVCNPLTRTSLKLPPMSSVRRSIRCTGIMEGDAHSRQTYKVVAVGRSRRQNAQIVEIYDSADKSWRIAGHLPEDVQVTGLGRLIGMGMGMRMSMVFCDCSFYCLTVFNGALGVLSFSIRHGASDFVPLPHMANEKRPTPYLLACRSRVLVAVGIVKEEEGVELLQELIIWELEQVNSSSSSSSLSASSWKEIARMPPSLCGGVNRMHSLMDWPFNYCIGVGDYACFIFLGHMREMKVVVYNVIEKTWNWLPSCPLDYDKGYVRAMRVMAFEPRPGMKIT